MSETNDLGLYLEISRYSKRFSLREAAKITGLSHAYIRDIEIGINRSTNKEMTPSPLTLSALADCYGIDHLILYKMAGFIDENEFSTMIFTKKEVEAVDVTMDDEKSVIPSYHFECELCVVEFSIKEGRHYNVFEVCCPLCKSQNHLIRLGKAAIVLENPEFVKFVFGENELPIKKRKTRK